MLHLCCSCVTTHMSLFLLYFFSGLSLSCCSLAFPSSQTSSPASSLALSTESLSSSSSDHSAVPQQLAANEQDHLFTKSVSEPSINTPASALSQKTKLQPHCSPNLPPPPPPTNTNSAPATPQTNRSVRPPRFPSSQTPSTPGKVRFTVKITLLFKSFESVKTFLCYVMLCCLFTNNLLDQK